MEIVEKTATVTPVESENPNGEFEVILSTEALDRDAENLWADEWKMPLPERIHIDGDHGRTLEKTVGSAVPRIEGNRMVAKGTYAGTEYAQMVRQLVNEGHINSLSVTYAEHKNQKNASGVERELLNAAFVAIPANPEAVVLASKSAKVPTRNKAMFEVLKKYVDEDTAFKMAEGTFTADEAREFFTLKAVGGLSASGNNPEVKHDAMVQAIHDAAYALGASCMNAEDADSGADEGANKSWQWFRDADGNEMYRVVGESQLYTGDELLAQIKAATMTSTSKEVGSPQETEESTAPTADKAAETAEESADDAARQKAKEAEKARALAWLISQNTKEN